MSIDERIPERVRGPLAAYANAMRSSFGEALIGVYVQGSIALGDFDPKTSDIDVLTVVAVDDEASLPRARRARLERLFFDRGVAFAVQTIPRILHTLETNTIISKKRAVALLRERFPEWAALTEPCPLHRRPERALETRRFILAMIEYANRTFGL